ncbi:MAG: PQQ-binding-like beta-propeller repeat protein [Planctomycetota bacterium]
MSASQFIQMLESKGLLDPESILELQKMVEQSKVRVTPEALARILVENGQLTRFQATKLVTELKQQQEASAAAKASPSTATSGSRKSPNDSVEDLLPADEVEPVEVVEVVEDVVQDAIVEVAEVVEESSGSSGKSKKKRQRTSDSLGDDSLKDVAMAKAPVAKTIPEKSPWETFGIIGVGFIVLLLLTLLVPLYIWFSAGNAKESWEIAENFYKNRDYERAAKQYELFSTNFPADENASIAKVKANLAKVREASEKNADPSVGLKSAQEQLPKVVNEAGMSNMRVEITDVLLRIAEKFIAKADNTAGIEDRKTLVASMNQQMELIRDPRYVGTQERTQNELRIRRIEEDQQRVVREIQQSEDLDVAIKTMTASVEAKDVNKTYDLRKDLVKKYPILDQNSKLRDLMLQATEIQKGSVAKSNAVPMIQDTVSLFAAPTALLTSRVGNPIDSNPDDVAFLRVKGSVVALAVADGKVLWRKFIGRDWSGDPKRISATADSDTLVAVASRGTVSRLAAKDGAVVWESKFPEPIQEPSIDGDDIFVTTTGGSVHCLDAISGQPRWSKKIPQAIDVPTGGAVGKRKRYLLGNHSNLYVLSRGNGECDEVVYIGHNPGTIAVPPIWVLNQLILFENAGPDHSLMRVYSTNDEGTELTQAQSPVRFKGHVVVEPQVEGRRLAVATNLGEIAILDVEVTNPKEKVFKMVNLVSNEAAPKATWPLMSGTDLWLASNRLSYFQIQITGQKLNSIWLKEDLDEFTARPIKLGDVILHSRVVRGNAGVRVAAINPKTGDAYWETDIGNPVASLALGPQGIVAVTSQAATFDVADAAFATEPVGLKPTMSIENMGRTQRSMTFANPIQLTDGRSLLLNSAQGSQMLLVDPARKSTSTSKLVVLDLAGSYPISESITVGNLILVPLENAQLLLLDPETGKQIGTAFQPTISAGERPVWMNPVLLGDKQSVVIADQRRNLYKLSTGKQLRLLNAQPLERGIKGRIDVINDVVVGLSPGPSGDFLDFYESGEFKKVGSLNFEGRFAWGPYTASTDSQAIGLALSDIEGLVAFSSQGKLLWSQPMPQTVLVGKPIFDGSDILIASTTGELIRVSATDGKIIAKTTAGEPISGTPVITPKGLLVPGDEGTVLRVSLPLENTLGANPATSEANR